ncbi:MAG: hypothetical protein K6B28_08445 [Lachnospiraceae bacterium]|nr:hypothetical protein [Lachnospiraceae bacterium]
MAGKFGKILAFATIAGAACAGIYYFFLRDEVNEPEDAAGNKESDLKKFFDEMPSREYVPLNKNAAEADKMKSSIKDKIDQAAEEEKERKQEEADGVGLVKDDVKTDDFEFKDLDKDSDKEDDKSE